MADKSYEKHIEDLIKVRSEIRKAGECYCDKDFPREAYHMIKAIAIADALGIEQDEFFLHKRIVEKEFNMQDTLIMEDLMTHFHQSPPTTEVWLCVILRGDGDNDILPFYNEEEAFKLFKETLDEYFNEDGLKFDSFGNTYEQCYEVKEFFIEENLNHYDVQCYVIKQKIR